MVRLQEYLAPRLTHPEAVWVLDGSDFPKQGRKSVAVARQYCGRLGKVASCQAGMFLAYVSPLGRALVDKRLYLKDDAGIFMGRLTRDPNDIRVFGWAIGMQHKPGRDDATLADIELRPWKEQWSRYIRVDRAEFVAGTMVNGVSLNELMNPLSLTQVNLNRPIWPFLLAFIVPVLVGLTSFGILFWLPDCGVDESWWEVSHMRLVVHPVIFD